MEKGNHRIWKQIIEVEHQTAGKKDKLSDELSNLANFKIHRIVEKIFDEFHQQGIVFQIDKLEIDLECNDIEDLERILVDKIPSALKQKLEVALSDSTNTKVIPEAEHWFKNYVFYLKKGYLPWNTPVDVDFAELEFRVTEALDEKKEWSKKLIKLLLDEPVMLQRFSVFSSIKMKWRIVDQLWPGIKETINSFDFPIESHQGFSPQFWNNLFKVILSGKKDKDELKQILRQGKLIHEDSTGNDLKLKAKPKIEEGKSKDKVSDEGIFIKNAGIVILHPFIQTLFEELKVAKGNKITNPGKALRILDYCVKGEIHSPEWNFPLPKILCGIPVEKIIPIDTSLNEHEKKEIEKMLNALISHWKTVKNTGIDGLRETFLERGGRLQSTQKNWILRVEQTGVDILIEHLPWGFNRILLPWMDRPLITEW